MNTMADGIAVGLPGDDHVRRGPRVRRRHRHRLRGVDVTGAAGAGRAGQDGRRAGRARPRSPRCSTTRTAFETPAVAVLSGGNIDPLLLGKVIRHGMAAAGRYLNLRVCIPDLPGGLATLLTELGEAGANVLEVAHERISPSLHLDEVEVQLQLETRGEPHAEQVARPAPRARLPHLRVADPSRLTRIRGPAFTTGRHRARATVRGQPVEGTASTISTLSSLAVGRGVARRCRPWACR